MSKGRTPLSQILNCNAIRVLAVSQWDFKEILFSKFSAEFLIFLKLVWTA